MKISEQVQNKETKTALILEPWGVNEITSDEMQFLELVYISGKKNLKFKKDSEFFTKLSSSREISVVVSSEAITYKKKSRISNQEEKNLHRHVMLHNLAGLRCVIEFYV